MHLPIQDVFEFLGHLFYILFPFLLVAYAFYRLGYTSGEQAERAKQQKEREGQEP